MAAALRHKGKEEVNERQIQGRQSMLRGEGEEEEEVNERKRKGWKCVEGRDGGKGGGKGDTKEGKIYSWERGGNKGRGEGKI